MTEKENDINKLFENLFDKLNGLIQEVEKHAEEDEEQDDLDYKAKISTRLSTKIKIALIDFIHEDKNITFAALCDVVSSYGVHMNICKKAQMSAFEKCVDHHIRFYSTHKEKMDKIKEILKGK